MRLDHDALLRLLLNQRAMLMGYLLSIVRDRHLAEDLLQEVSLLVLRKGGAISDESAFPAWVRRIARYEALNTLRKRGHLPQSLEEPVLDALESHWEASDVASPSDSIEALRRCVEKLTPRARQILDLRYREEIRGESLAEKLSQPANTVYVALSRIHRALAECVKSNRLNEGTAHG